MASLSPTALLTRIGTKPVSVATVMTTSPLGNRFCCHHPDSRTRRHQPSGRAFVSHLGAVAFGALMQAGDGISRA